MQTLEWYPWHWKNWRLSDAREQMTAEQRGIYRELLDLCWADGSFDLDPARLAKVCGLTAEGFRQAWSLLQAWFEQRPDGRWFNANMATITQEQSDRHALMIARAKKGGAATKAKWHGRKKATSLPQAGFKQASSVQIERQRDSLTESSTTAPPAGSGGPVLCNCGGAERKSGIHSPNCRLAEVG